jgi:hypothetical protein
MTAPSDAGDLGAFFARVAEANPFTDNRVNGPSETDVDVDQVHQAAFDRLVDLAREAWQEARGLGAVLWGEAGVGKSHVLSRLARWAKQDRHAVFVYLHNLQASPENLPRSVLKAVVSILTEGRVRHFHPTPLYRILNATVAHALERYQPGPPSWPRAEAAYSQLLDDLSAAPSRASLVDRTVYDVLFHLFRSEYEMRAGREDGQAARWAVRWLSGDALDPAEARALGLTRIDGAERPVALTDSQQVKQVLVALTQLAWFRKQPFVLAFDQVDNLETGQFAALARFVEALIDSSPNLLVVTSGVQATLIDWLGAKVIQSSAWDRVAQFEVRLQRVTPAEAGHILSARLDRFFAPFRTLDDVAARRHQDPLFPLGTSWLEAVLRDKIEVRPRDALNWAREAWRREQETLRQDGGLAWLANWAPAPAAADRPSQPLTDEQVAPVIDARVEQKLAEHRTARLKHPETLPPDAANVAGLVQALLAEYAPDGSRLLVVQQPHPSRRGRKRTYNLVVRRRGNPGAEDARAGLLFLVTPSAQSTTRALGRLLEDPNPPARVLLVTDERQPLHLAEKGEQDHRELLDRGPERFRHLVLPFARYAELDALRATVGEARSGDLEIELPGGKCRQVTEAEVVACHHRRGRYGGAAVVADVLDALGHGKVQETGRLSTSLTG